MSRHIYCLKCGGAPGELTIVPPERSEMGWSMRVVYLSNNRWELRCDACNELMTGEIVVAVSRIPPGREMREWEPEFGEPLTVETVNAYLKLAEQKKPFCRGGL